jgi:hypothetical protein
VAGHTAHGEKSKKDCSGATGDMRQREPKSEMVLREWITMLQRANRKPLSDWESSFVDDMERALDKYGRLSEKQEDVLERIYAEKT